MMMIKQKELPSLLKKFFIISLVGQISLAIINSLFILDDKSGVVALIGLIGIHQMHITTLLIFSLLNVLSIAFDILRITIWKSYISNLLNSPAIIGYYYLVVTGFGIALKIVRYKKIFQPFDSLISIKTKAHLLQCSLEDI